MECFFENFLVYLWGWRPHQERIGGCALSVNFLAYNRTFGAAWCAGVSFEEAVQHLVACLTMLVVQRCSVVLLYHYAILTKTVHTREVALL